MRYLDVLRMIGGYTLAVFVLVYPFPYTAPFWQRGIGALFALAMVDSTRVGIMLRNLAGTLPAIAGSFLGRDRANAMRERPAFDRRAGGDTTKAIPEVRPTRRKTDRYSSSG